MSNIQHKYSRTLAPSLIFLHTVHRRSCVIMPRNSAKLGDTAVEPVGEDTVDLTSDERRGTPRYGFTATAEVVDMGSRTRMNTRISDLASMERLLCGYQRAFPRCRTKVRIRVTASKKLLETQGVVVLLAAQHGHGNRLRSSPKPLTPAILNPGLTSLAAPFPPALSPAKPTRPLPPNPPTKTRSSTSCKN